MSEKYVIFGATGSIGSSLAEQLKNSGNDIHLVGRNESELSSISEKLGCSHTAADVLEEGFIEKVKSDISEIKGLAYCCLLYTSPSPRDRTRSRMPSSA